MRGVIGTTPDIVSLVRLMDFERGGRVGEKASDQAKME